MNVADKPEEKELQTRSIWPLWKLGALLYPFTAAAVAINLFMLSLMGQAIGLIALPPKSALIASFFLGIPATYATARWVKHLLKEAEHWDEGHQPNL